MKPKILEYYHTYHYPLSGGVESYIHSVCKGLRDRFNFYFLGDWKESLSKRENLDGVIVYRAGPAKPEGKAARLFDAIFNGFSRERDKERILQLIEPDIIQIHGPINFSGFSLFGFLFLPFYSKQAWRRSKAKKIMTYHGLPEVVMKRKIRVPLLFSIARFFWKIIEAKNIRDSDYTVCVDRYVIEDLTARREIDKNKLVFIPNGVDRKKFKPSNKHVSRNIVNKIFHTGLTKKDFVIAYVARVSKEKGANDIPKLKSLNEKFKVLVCGDGPLLESVKRECEGDERFLFLGPVDYSFLPNIYGACDVVFNPADHPGSTRTSIEAVACGRPVVVKSILDRHPVIQGKTGVLYETEDDISQAFTSVRKLKLKASTFESAIADYDIRKTSKMLESVFRQCLSSA
jgi:glycosyltransferase involved in cell wall biosynthesis